MVDIDEIRVLDQNTLNRAWDIVKDGLSTKLSQIEDEESTGFFARLLLVGDFDEAALLKSSDKATDIDTIKDIIKNVKDISIRLSLLYNNINIKSPLEIRVAREGQEPKNVHTTHTLPGNFWLNNDCSIITLGANHNWAECKKLTKDVFNDINKLYFFVPKEKKIPGRLISVMATYPKPTTLVRVIERFNRESGETENEICFLDEKINYRNYTVTKKITFPVYFHSFIAEDGRKFVLLSRKKLLPQRGSVWGLNFMLTDESKLGESVEATIPIETPLIFLHSLEPAVPNIDEKGYLGLCGQLTHEGMAKATFGDFRHPEWFEKVMFSLFFHFPFGEYPMHLFWFAASGTGKSTLMDNLKGAFDEEKVFTGAGSTLKGLVPSFGSTLPEPGYLATTNRFSLVDEFLRVISHERRHEREGVDEKLGIMNDLLEHRLRDFRSGKGKAELQMTSRVILATNPIYTTKNVVDLARQIDNAFLSRFLLYNQTRQHIEFVQHKAVELATKKPEKAKISEDLISLTDFLQRLRVDLDYDKINKIFESIRKNVPEGMYEIYDARYHHHLQCIADGYIKYKSILRKTMPKAEDEDYEEIEKLLLTLVMSWKEAAELDIFNVPLKVRHTYVSLNAATVFEKVQQSVRSNPDELVALFKNELSEGDVWAGIDELRRCDLLKQTDHRGKEVLVPWWYTGGSVSYEDVKRSPAKEMPMNEVLLHNAFKAMDTNFARGEDLEAQLEHDGVLNPKDIIAWGMRVGALFESRPGFYKLS